MKSERIEDFQITASDHIGKTATFVGFIYNWGGREILILQNETPENYAVQKLENYSR